MNRKPERGELQQLLDHCHLAVGTWAPGDGHTRYRFFPRQTPRVISDEDAANARPGAHASGADADYHAGDGLFTALGRGEAVTWLRGYRTALQQRATVVATHTGPAVKLTNAGTMQCQSVEQAEQLAAAVNRFDARGGAR